MIYGLDKEAQYLRAIGVRGHQFLLKERCKTYLLNKANEVLRNKYRRRRLKQVEHFQTNLVNRWILFEEKNSLVDCATRETYKYFSQMFEKVGLLD